jgi:uncharacterized protein GlcG (DUF336 family)
MDWRIPLFLLAPVSPLFAQRMEIEDVRQVLAQAVQEAKAVSPADNRVIAVTDREGHVLAVWDVNGAAAPNPTPSMVADVVSKAGAAGFLSSDQHAFTSRTAAFIVQNHFPPAVENRPNGPLVGVNFSSMAFSDTNKFKAPSAAGTFPLPPVPGVDDLGSATPADAFRSVPFTSLLTLPAAVSSPGGVPLFKNGVLVGGIGVMGFADALVEDFDIFFQANINERIALGGQAGFRPDPVFGGNNVAIDGVRLAYVVGGGSNATVANPAAFLAANGSAVTFADIDGIPASADNGSVDYSPKASPPAVVYPNPFGLTGPGGVPGQLRSAIRADPLPGTIAGEARLSAAEVESILRLAAERTVITRAGIRLPRGQITQVWISVVNNPNAAGVEPVVLGTYRTPDATIFSWDVAVQKARTALFFSRGLERAATGTPRAFSSRSVGFLAQDRYPPGIGDKAPGPLFGFQGALSLDGVGKVPAAPINLNVPNGITIFPGGLPLYRNGVIVGAIGVSGDGIEQDDIVAASGARDFLAPQESRADNFVYERARLPYAKFPRASTSF